MEFLRPAPPRSWREATGHLSVDEFVTVRGQRVRVDRHGSGYPLVLLHGIAASSYSFRDLVPLLDDEFETLAIDLNGFGYTERSKDPAAYRIEEQAELIFKVMERLGHSEFALCGHSYGAAVAAMLARRHPGAVSKIILISPVLDFPPPPWYLRNGVGLRMAYWGTRFLLSNPARFRKVISRSFFAEGVLTETVSEEYRNSMLIEGFRAAFFGYAKALGSHGRSLLKYDEPTIDTVVLAGSEDPIVSVAGCQDLVNRMRCADLIVLPACGHSAPEEFPDKVAEILKSFLNAR